MPATLSDLLPYGNEVTNDLLLDRFLDYVASRGLALYPAQEEAILELFEGKNVILNTPTGSGKSLVASALHLQGARRGRALRLHVPDQGAGQREVAGAVPRVRPGKRRAATGDATVNRDAPILCCTAEILANIALREGAERRRPATW